MNIDKAKIVFSGKDLLHTEMFSKVQPKTEKWFKTKYIIQKLNIKGIKK